MEKIVLIDGNSIMNRAYYALPTLTNKDGEYTNAVYGFLNIIFKILDEEKPEYMGVAFDLRAPTFRHEKFKEYKGNRKPMPDELRPQFPLLKQLLQKMNVNICEMEGYEADDILGTLSEKAKKDSLDTVIISGDRDLLQLAAENIKIRIPKTKSGKTEVEDYTEKDVLEKIGVMPREYIDVKALMGDASDNIPGVPGIGEKTAISIIQTYHDIDTAIQNASSIKPKKASENIVAYKEQAVLSKELATIVTDVPLEFKAEEFSIQSMYNEEALNEIKRLGFKSHIERFSKPGAQSLEQKAGDFLEITEAGSARAYIEQLLNKELVACSLIEAHDKLVGLALSDGPAKGRFFKINSDFNKNDAAEAVRPLMESDVKKILLDSKKAMLFFDSCGISVKNICFDSSLAGYILNSSKSAYYYNDIALDFLDETYPSMEEIFGKGKGKVDPDSIDPSQLLIYACRQAEVVFRSYEKMKAMLEENGQHELYYNIELPLADVLKDMEIFGIRVDKEALTEYGHMLDQAINGLREDIYLLAGEEFNINSTQQLGIVLFEKLGLKTGKKTKTGYSTAHEVLEKLFDKHPIIPKILDYRTYAKLKSTYVDGLLSVIEPATGKIYSKFNQTITTTGRISSSEPNLQNIPIKLELGRKLRKVFIPADDSYVFVDGDYSQIELRVLAHMSGDETLINAFKEGQDIHRLTASQVFRTSFDEVTPLQRSNAKAVNFGIIYGMGSFSLSQDLGITKKEAQQYIDGYFEKYPKIKEFLNGCVDSAKESGYAKTIFNRRRLIPEISSSNFVQRSFGERVAMNMPIQGSAADIIKIAMVQVSRRLRREGLASRLILQVHDELLVEAKKDELEQVKKILKEEMEGAVKLLVPLETDFHQGDNWYDAK